MSSLFTQSEKTLFSDYFNDIHDTFKRPVYMFKQRDELVIENNPNHSYIWDNAPQNTQTQSVINSGTFYARILYSTKQDKDFISLKEGQVGGEVFGGDVRMKLDPTGAAFVGDFLKIRLDGALFEVLTEPRQHGLFDPKWTTLYLKRMN